MASHHLPAPCIKPPKKQHSKSTADATLLHASYTAMKTPAVPCPATCVWCNAKPPKMCRAVGSSC